MSAGTSKGVMMMAEDGCFVLRSGSLGIGPLQGERHTWDSRRVPVFPETIP